MLYQLFSPNAAKDKEPVEIRLALHAMGYDPVPILAAQKKPLIPGWNSGPMSEQRIIELSRQYSDHVSTGLRTGPLAGIDIDLHNTVHAEALRIMVEDFLGPTPLGRVGSKGVMLSYRNTDPSFTKLSVIGDD